MDNIPLRQNKYNWRSLEPTRDEYLSDEYTKRYFDLYLKAVYTRNDYGFICRRYRLHANKPHTIEMALAYDITCPKCRENTLKQVGRCQDHYTLGLYECPVCDKKNRRK